MSPLFVLAVSTAFAVHHVSPRHPVCGFKVGAAYLPLAQAENLRDPMMFGGIGSVSHPILTANSATQKYFDQGLALVYGFNFPEAIRSFQHAAELDPSSPMPCWGIALANGRSRNASQVPKTMIRRSNGEPAQTPCERCIAPIPLIRRLGSCSLLALWISARGIYGVPTENRGRTRRKLSPCLRRFCDAGLII